METIDKQLADLGRRIRWGDTAARLGLEDLLREEWQLPSQRGEEIEVFSVHDALQRIKSDQRLSISEAVVGFLELRANPDFVPERRRVKIWETPENFGYRYLDEYLKEIQNLYWLMTTEVFLSAMLVYPEWVREGQRVYAAMALPETSGQRGILCAWRTAQKVKITLTWSNIRVGSKISPERHARWLIVSG